MLEITEDYELSGLTGDYIHLFETYSEFTAARSTENYHEPWLSYTLETSGVAYNKSYREKLPETPLTFLALEDGTFRFSGSTTANTLSYSLDGGETWIALVHDADTPTVSAGSRIMWKGTCTQMANSGIGKFISSCKFDVECNIMSILYGDEFMEQLDLSYKPYALYGLFSGNTNVVNTMDMILPATILSYACYEYMFLGCTSLITAPELPATTLRSHCYEGMFWKCASLATTQILPATTLAEDCYARMFAECSSLIDVSELPAATLTNYCYFEMFSGCTNLTTAPALPATTLANYCYYGMFSGCRSLTTAPKLQVVTLTKGCYYGMFMGCTSLTTAPELPATTLEIDCYAYMFEGCTSLTTAPDLLASQLRGSCYEGMFQFCSNLNYIKCLATNIAAGSCTTNWVDGVASAGTFVMHPNMSNWTVGIHGIPTNWIQEVDYAGIPLTFVVRESGTFRFSGSTSTNTLSYSLDNGVTWTTLAHSADTPTVQSGSTIMWKGSLIATYYGSGKFISNGSFDVCGNVMSLLYNDNFISQTNLYSNYQFFHLFSGNTHILNANNMVLPAMVLSKYCYSAMFIGCTNLISAPNLPATSLTESCYSSMFEGCTSLTTAPDLLATTLTPYCYSNMFRDCTNLNYIKCLATDISATNCTNFWVYRITSLGTFVKAYSATWSFGVSGIPSGWDVEDAS